MKRELVVLLSVSSLFTLCGITGCAADEGTVQTAPESTEIVLTIDSTSAALNGTAHTLDTTPVIINDRTMMPIRFIAEGFGFDVEWEQTTQTVTLSGSVTEDSQTEPTAAPTASATATPAASATAEPSTGSQAGEQEESRMLVVYFSATGNTESLAQTIAEVTGADIYEIVPEDPYTSEDLDYTNDDCRANQEMNDPDARPAIAGSVENMDEYDTILLGYPIWWGTMPRIINTFLDSYDMSGKTIMPFCTSGGTGITTSVSDIRDICTDSEVTDGLKGSASTGQADIEKWLEGKV